MSLVFQKPKVYVDSKSKVLTAEEILLLELEEIIRRLQDRNLRKVAANVGLDEKTLYRIMNRETTEKVTYDTVKKLSDYLENKHEE